jgi:hypothetical protein
MDEHPPSLASASPRTSPLAIWSLVLGILGLTCFSLFSSIPAVICGHIAHGRIKRSDGMLTGDGMALAGLITGYLGIALAILVIPLMLAVAVPNFAKARASAMKNVCVNQLREIDAAKEQWALEKTKEPSDLPQANELLPYLRGRAALPSCPAGGSYSINSVDTLPTCSVPDHEL